MRGPGTRRLLAALTLIALAQSGCESHDEPRTRPAWRIPALESHTEQLSRQVILLAGSHLRHLAGEPTWLDADFMSPVDGLPTRAVELDVWSSALFSFAIGVSARKVPVIHLGNAIDLACTPEWERFTYIMGAAKQGWLMTPGNHEGNFMGSGHFATDAWQRACSTEDGRGQPMTKDRWVQAYLAALARQDELGFAAPEAALREPGAHEWSSEDPSALLQAVAWRIDSVEPWRSYVVQRLNLAEPREEIDGPADEASDLMRPDPIVAILLDTTQYGRRPDPSRWPILGRPADEIGELQADQIDVIDRWLAAAVRPRSIALLGHHPYAQLEAGARSALGRWRAAGVELLVTAHRQESGYILHESDGERWLELSVGSVTGWPPELRRLVLMRGEAEDEHVYQLRRVRLDRFVERLEVCRAEWGGFSEDASESAVYADFLGFDAEHRQRRQADALFATYDRLLQSVPSAATNAIWPAGEGSDESVRSRIASLRGDHVARADQRAYLRALATFEAEREPADYQERNDYRACRGFWASHRGRDAGRAPDVGEWELIFSGS